MQSADCILSPMQSADCAGSQIACNIYMCSCHRRIPVKDWKSLRLLSISGCFLEIVKFATQIMVSTVWHAHSTQLYLKVSPPPPPLISEKCSSPECECITMECVLARYNLFSVRMHVFACTIQFCVDTVKCNYLSQHA